MSQNTEKKVASLGVLEAIAALDAALTLASRVSKWLESRREVGEMTPEEEEAMDAANEKLFAQWQTRTPKL